MVQRLAQRLEPGARTLCRFVRSASDPAETFVGIRPDACRISRTSMRIGALVADDDHSSPVSTFKSETSTVSCPVDGADDRARLPLMSTSTCPPSAIETVGVAGGHNAIRPGFGTVSARRSRRSRSLAPFDSHHAARSDITAHGMVDPAAAGSLRTSSVRVARSRTRPRVAERGGAVSGMSQARADAEQRKPRESVLEALALCRNSSESASSRSQNACTRRNVEVPARDESVASLQVSNRRRGGSCPCRSSMASQLPPCFAARLATIVRAGVEIVGFSEYSNTPSTR